jgi:hypothetical protein
VGYTHYWRVREDVPRNLLAAAHFDMARIVQATKADIAGWDGNGEPSLTEGEIRFNGRGPNDDHETFSWPMDFEARYPNWQAGETWDSEPKTDPSVAFLSADREEERPRWGFQFCKTAGKPYDQTVTACLLVAKKHLGDYIRLSSDGTFEEYVDGAETQWIASPESARDLYVRVMGEEPPVPWVEEDEE